MGHTAKGCPHRWAAVVQKLSNSFAFLKALDVGRGRIRMEVDASVRVACRWPRDAADGCTRPSDSFHERRLELVNVLADGPLPLEEVLGAVAYACYYASASIYPNN